jgi:hypothetical protein
MFTKSFNRAMQRYHTSPRKGARFSESMILLVAVIVVGILTQRYSIRYFSPANAPFNAYVTPAISFAFGEGLHDIGYRAGTKLEGFIARGAPYSLSREDLPPDRLKQGLTPFQESYSYLLILIGSFWKVFGVNWGALSMMVAFLASISFALCYLICRLVVEPIKAYIICAAYFLSPSHLALLMAPRDYAKTPFFLMISLLLGYLLLKRFNCKSMLLIGGAIGLCMGFGCGVRPDINIMWLTIPPIFLLSKPANHAARRFGRLAGLAVAIIMFLVSAKPILYTQHHRGSSMSHHLLGGLFRYHEELLGVGDASYLWHNESILTDNYINSIVQDANSQELGRPASIQFLGTEYNLVGLNYFWKLLWSFPADFLIRVVASSRTIIADGPWLTVGPSHTVYDVINPVIQRSQYFSSEIRHIWNQNGPLFTILALFKLSVLNFRVGIGLGIFLAILTGYPSIQFQPRHFGHLAIIPILIVGFCFAQMLKMRFHLRNSSISIATSRKKKYLRNFCLSSTLAIGILLSIPLARSYQSSVLNALVALLTDDILLPVREANIISSAKGTRMITFTPEFPRNDASTGTNYHRVYLALKFHGNNELPQRIRTFSDTADIPVHQLAHGAIRGPALVLFPILKQKFPHKLELIGGDSLASVSLFTASVQDVFPTLFTTVITNEERNFRAYKRLLPLNHH